MAIQFKNIDQIQPTSMTKRLVIYLSLLLIMVSPAVAIAASPSPSTSTDEEETESIPNPSPTDEALLSPEAIQKNKERLQRALQNQGDRIKGVLDELATKRRGMVGEVQRVSEESFTIKTNKATHVIAVTSDIKIQKGTKTITISDIAVGDWVIVISSEQEGDLVPDRIIVSATSLRPDPQVVALGSVVSVSRTRTELKIQTRVNSEERTFVLDRNTEYEDMTGNPAEVTDLDEDVQALVVGQETKDTILAKTIRILIPISQESDE